ncbi:MAG: hypothetical protein E7460_10990, partial [Ruminococcaceae bacterium]|nr:hypothetical protein [Oscillospiraceae bacterium]
MEQVCRELNTGYNSKLSAGASPRPTICTHGKQGIRLSTGHRQPGCCPDPQKQENWQIKMICQFSCFPLVKDSVAFVLFQSLTAVGAAFDVLFAFGLAVGAFLLFGRNHDNDHDHKNNHYHNSDPNEDAQSKRYGTEAAEGAFILFVHRGL